MNKLQMDEILVKEKIDLTVIELLNLVSPKYHNMVADGYTFSSRTVNITPEIAKIFLKYNTENRPLRISHVNFLAREMSKDNWIFTGESIKFNRDGGMFDGQHRLHAIIKSGKPQVLLVQYGLNQEAFTRVDTGKKRSPSDVFSIQNVPNSTIAAPLCRNLINIKRGIFSDVGTNSSISNYDLLNFYLSKPYLEGKVTISYTLYKKSNHFLEPSVLATSLVCLTSIDEEKGMDFMKKLCLGNDLGSNSPILKLRNMIYKLKNEKKKYEYKQLYLLIFYTWGLYIRGKTIKSKEIKLPENYKIDLIFYI